MAPTAKYLYFAMMDVDADKEALFNEVYDTEHVPALLKVPGCRAVTRCKAQDFAMFMGGKRLDIPIGDNPTYMAIYELDSPDVVLSPEWSRAVDLGRWPAEVRPFTRNKRWVMHKVVAA
jgi:hypothetical protein